MAHMPIHVGSVVGLIRDSDLVVVATVASQIDSPTGGMTTQIRDGRVLASVLDASPATFVGPVRFEKDQRYVFFLRRDRGGMKTVQSRGMIYPCPSGADETYEALVEAVRGVGPSESDAALAPLRRALIEALASPVEALRNHAALELLGMTHGEHQLNEGERDRLRAVVASPDFDPGLRAALAELASGR